MILVRCVALLAWFSTLAIGGCGRGFHDPNAALASPSGHLVIVGGGLKPDNAPVHQRFVQLCTEGPIGIIPIASGDGLQAGESSAEGWRKWAGERQVIVIPLTQNDAARSDDPEISRQIAHCGGLWFTGGDQSRVVSVLKPNGRSSACLDACVHVLARNGVIGGTSAGAALMSDPMITGGQSYGRPTRDPDETASTVRTGPGLGFLSHALTDQHFLERGRMGRLIDAMHATGVRIGLGVRENAAVVVDRATTECEPIGDRAVCAIVLEGDCARVSVLSTGDHANLRAFSATPAQGLVRLDRGAGGVSVEPVPDPWALKTMESVLDQVAQGHTRQQRSNDRVIVTVEADAHSDIFQDPSGHRPAFLGALCVRQEHDAHK